MIDHARIHSLCRRELEDTTPPYLWSDETLRDLIDAALGEYGRLCPLPATYHGQMVIGQRHYPLPADCQRPLRVEWPTGRPIQRATTAPPDESPTGWMPVLPVGQHWRWAATLPPTLTVADAPRAVKAFTVHYLAQRRPPATEDDPWPVSEEDLPVIVLLAAEAAWSRRQVATAKRGLASTGQVNPFSPRLATLLGRRRRIARGGNLQQDS